jgi:hypothetical protein
MRFKSRAHDSLYATRSSRFPKGSWKESSTRRIIAQTADRIKAAGIYGAGALDEKHLSSRSPGEERERLTGVRRRSSGLARSNCRRGPQLRGLDKEENRGWLNLLRRDSHFARARIDRHNSGGQSCVESSIWPSYLDCISREEGLIVLAHTLPHFSRPFGKHGISD